MKVKIFSDGSSKGNPGPGGYGTIIKYYDNEDNCTKTEEFTEGFENTTNNRMELLGVITGFKNLLDGDLEIQIISDSQYVTKAINDNWLDNWVKNNWKTATNKPVKNKDLWEIILEYLNIYPNHKFIWVKGHSGHPENERCDQLANWSSDKKELEKKDGIYKIKVD